MPDLAANIIEPVGGFEMQGMMMRYSLFVPRLYNWCKSLGFEQGKIMPSGSVGKRRRIDEYQVEFPAVFLEKIAKIRTYKFVPTPFESIYCHVLLSPFEVGVRDIDGNGRNGSPSNSVDRC